MTVVDLYTDASNKAGAGGWATVVIRPGSEPFEASGPLRDHLNSSTLAELRGIGNALHAAIKAGIVQPGDRVVVRCDNTGAVGRVAGRTTSRPKDEGIAHAAAWIATKAKAAGITITARHVKGHQPLRSLDPHAVHNRRCDYLCGLVTGTRKAPAPRKPTKAELAKLAAEEAARKRRAKLAAGVEAVARLTGRAEA